MKSNISSYMGEALHTSSKYLVNRDFALDFTSMENTASAINKCESQENTVYSFYGASSFSQFMEKIRNNFIQNPQDAIIFSYFQHGNLKRKLGELARAMKAKKKDTIILDYQVNITLEDNASPEFRDAIKMNFPKRVKSNSLGLNLGIAAQKKRMDEIIRTIMAQESKRSKKGLSKAEVYRRLEQGLIEGISFTSDSNHSDTISNAIEVNSKLGHFPWGFYKDDIKMALQQQDGYYYQKLQEALPDNVALAMSPMKLDTIDFQSNNANDVNIISEAYENIINANGGIVLNQNKITNSASFKLALQFDSMDAMAPVDQINAWLNLWILNHLGETGIIAEYDGTSPYFVNDRIDQLLKASQYGLPVKLELASLVSTNPVKERGMSFMEDALGLGVTSWVRPLVSSNTQSGLNENGDGSDGRPKSDDPLSDEGEATRDGAKNKK